MITMQQVSMGYPNGFVALKPTSLCFEKEASTSCSAHPGRASQRCCVVSISLIFLPAARSPWKAWDC